MSPQKVISNLRGEISFKFLQVILQNCWYYELLRCGRQRIQVDFFSDFSLIGRLVLSGRTLFFFFSESEGTCLVPGLLIDGGVLTEESLFSEESKEVMISPKKPTLDGDV